MLPVILLVVGGLALMVGLIYWDRIRGWAESALFPWVRQHLPALEETVREAFATLDGVAVAVRRVVKAAWEKLRGYLLKQVVEFERTSDNVFLCRVTSWLRRALSKPEPVVEKRVVEQTVDWDDLPSDVRDQLLRQDKASVEIDVVRTREQELAMAN